MSFSIKKSDDVVVVDGQGDYLFHRKVQVPRLHHTMVSHLPILSCAMFFRRRLVFGGEPPRHPGGGR